MWPNALDALPPRTIGEQMSRFVYLLNAMELAAEEVSPSLAGYGEKRRAVFEYVEDIERRLAEAYQRDAELWRLMKRSYGGASDVQVGNASPSDKLESK